MLTSIWSGGTANGNESNVITVRSRAVRRNVLWLVKPVWGDTSVVWWTQRTESGPLDWLVSDVGVLVFALCLYSLQFLASFARLWKLLRCWTSEKWMNKLIAQAVIFTLFCWVFFLAFIDCRRRVRTLSDSTRCRLTLLPSDGFSSCSCRTATRLFIGTESKYLLTCPPQSSRTFWLLLGSGAAPVTSLHTHVAGGRHSSRADSRFCCDNGKNEISSDSTSKLCLRPVGPAKTQSITSPASFHFQEEQKAERRAKSINQSTNQSTSHILFA